MNHTLSPVQQQFRDAMAFCAAGVHVITTDGAAGRFGITMTALAAVTDQPPTLMLCVNRHTRIYPVLRENGLLCVNVLSAAQRDVAEHFAGITRLTPEERFEQHIWHRGASGQLQVDGALAHLHGRITAQQDIGTHGVFFVEIDEIRLHGKAGDAALVYFCRAFGSLA